ncbi:MAG: DUF2281 domain-containing protein [Phormidesmis sp.]
MTAEQQLIETWRKLPEHKQQEVIDFAHFLEMRRRNDSNGDSLSKTRLAESPLEASKLGEKLKGIRDRIVASDIPLLTPEEVKQEVLARRGGY